MDITLLIALAAVLLIVILGIALFLRSNKAPAVVAEARARPVPNRLRDGAPRRAQLARNRGARLRTNVAQQEAEQSDEENEANAARDDLKLPDGKIGAKKMAKLEAKAEKKAQREAEEQTRVERKKKEDAAERERKLNEEKQKAEDKQREEEEKKLKDEKEKREYEEYLKMKEAFSVEEEGFEDGEEGDQQNLLQEFVSYVQNNKVVVIEDLAAQFKLKTQACIDRIKDLQKDDILTGVIDDRGKFIFVCPEEMEAVAKFIRQRGRVSIAELADNSNKLINITPNTALVK